MSRAFYLSGVAFLFVALVLSFLSSISLPYLPAIDFVRVKFSGSSFSESLTQVRWGIWGPCVYNNNDHRVCAHTGHGYAVPIETLNGQRVIVGASFTRGLAIHPVATGAIAIAFGFAASKYENGPLVASLASFFSALMLVIAFAIDIVLFANVHHEIGKLKNVRANVNAGSAFWMTLVSLVFVLLAGCTVCLGRRKDSGSNSYPMLTRTSGGFMSRFRK
ncbi:pali-domain-containing protein [Mycena belliarum]|uniref:Pali-domain-containing protein n=1 Tax=Mycena belliarum TaxID=1033014 RepID=A0AAD6UD06_9AGAR|nr:pali-domain-containing protein [Mycena belliae]